MASKLTDITLRKEKFARSRSREQTLGTFFNKTSNGLSSVYRLIIALFFTPALITSSIFSTEILLPFANICLSLGYLIDFFYRLYKNDISKAELTASLFTLTAFITLICLVFPPPVTFTLLSTIQFANQIAIVVNTFSVIRDFIIPPAKHILEQIVEKMGFSASHKPYFSKPDLTLAKDTFVVDKLLVNNYKHDSFSPNYTEKKLNQLNKALHMQVKYINKYVDVLFGYIKNKDKIDALEKNVNEYTTRGDHDATYKFIKDKIQFKTTKLNLLQHAEQDVAQTLKATTASGVPIDKKALAFFHTPVFKPKKDDQEILAVGQGILKGEIKRQQGKIAALQACLPDPDSKNQLVLSVK